jgi:hypothetical protein
MAVRGAAAVPPVRPRLASQPLGCRLALPLLLPVMGQLSKRFVVQHVLASFPTFGE